MQESPHKNKLNKILEDKTGEAYFKFKHDVLNFQMMTIGLWQRDYCKWLNLCFKLSKKKILDIGAGTGSTTYPLVKEQNADIDFLEQYKYLIENDMEFTLLDTPKEFKKGAKEYIKKHHICSTIQDAELKDNYYDFVHSHMVFEHIDENDFDSILPKVYNSLKKEGLFFIITTDSNNIDPTHCTLKPIEWWNEQGRKAGFTDITEKHLDNMQKQLKKIGHDFFKMYGVKNWKSNKDKSNIPYSKKDWIILIWQK